ncbi:MAG TPA: hypothetical protein VNH22_13640 [Blastocatellia bacterium]|jgi:hypothetical protein|nr:hypothetical protein [Blastocatellia bacterium]
MTTGKSLFIRLLIVTALVSLAPSAASASDRSFSSVVKHLKSNYRARGKSTFGFVNLARFAVKLVRPAGVKNFKVAMLSDLQYENLPGPGTAAFHSYIRNTVNPLWRPLFQYNAKLKGQWNYVYITEEGKDVKILAVALQQREAFVVQFKFSPDKLAKFIDDPKIMGISLKGDRNEGEGDRQIKTDADAEAESGKKSEEPPPITDKEPPPPNA